MIDARFRTWLRKQQQRDDPVGDLARDMHRAHAWPSRANTLPTLTRHLRRMGACHGACEALQRAFTEWQAEAVTP